MAVMIGVLALQGDFSMHQNMLKRLNVESLAIRTPSELDQCDALIIPGGESTTLVKLMKNNHLFEAIKTFNQRRPVYGTCAGCIVLAKTLSNYQMDTLGLIDITVERNAYGRQVDSFDDKISIPAFKENPQFTGVFIRAPLIRSAHENTRVLAHHNDEIVMARNERVLVTTFHPELTKDMRIHQYFIEDFCKSAL